MKLNKTPYTKKTLYREEKATNLLKKKIYPSPTCSDHFLLSIMNIDVLLYE